jgi:Ni,Fe-hydrogenase III large subunit/Ni,Fe-hydrogenase III component G
MTTLAAPQSLSIDDICQAFAQQLGTAFLGQQRYSDYYLGIHITSEALPQAANWLKTHPQLTCRFWTLFGIDYAVHQPHISTGRFGVHSVFFLKEVQQCLSLHFTLDLPPDGQTPQYPALSPIFPAANWHERELHDLFGITPHGIDLPPLVLHRDWPRSGRGSTHAHHYPMRADFDNNTSIPIHEVPHQFNTPEGEGRHQVAVGPIHAGIIEPGHLRFTVTGEKIHQFDAQLFYTHKGLEKMAQGQTPAHTLVLAENTCGLCAFSHSLALAQAFESLAQIAVPDRAITLRALLLEMERLASHFSDLSAICSAGGFGFASVRAAHFREQLMQWNQRLTGHRFLRGINQIGGLQRDIPESVLDDLCRALVQLQGDFNDWTELTQHTDSFLDRVEDTGYLSLENALAHGLVGPAARGSGVDDDMRRDLPVGVHRKLPVEVQTTTDGDAFGRFWVRVGEVRQSLHLAQTLIATCQPGAFQIEVPKPLPGYQPTLGVVESAKGSLIHWVMLDDHHHVLRWHVRSASYMNWRGVVMATMGNNIVPDGPLVNKSFNLCYACTDR